MTWLLRLYPPPWRRRYGGEVAEMLADQRFSLRIAIDLIAGAIAVWLHPSVTLAAAVAAEPHVEEKKTMLQRIARLDCGAALGPEVTTADQWRATAAALTGTIVLSLAWMAAHVRIGDNSYVDSLSMLTFIVPWLYSLRYTYLKKRPASVQAVFIGGFSLLIAAMMLAAGWIASHL